MFTHASHPPSIELWVSKIKYLQKVGVRWTPLNHPHITHNGERENGARESGPFRVCPRSCCFLNLRVFFVVVVVVVIVVVLFLSD